MEKKRDGKLLKEEGTVDCRFGQTRKKSSTRKKGREKEKQSDAKKQKSKSPSIKENEITSDQNNYATKHGVFEQESKWPRRREAGL